MRLYGKRFIKNRMTQQVEAKTETRDGIIWDVLPEQRIARVKIQGTNEYILAHYPLNWDQTPVWLKPGNAVRISHTGGIRNKIELVGHGVYIPTPVTGDSTPTPAGDSNAILTGCKVSALIPASMRVAVSAGSFRISGTIYYLGGVSGESIAAPMQTPAMMDMGSAFEMGTLMAAGIEIDAAPATPGYYRYDLIVVGIDSVVDYVKGTASADPVLPTVPTGHLECGRILLFYGMTVIEQIWIDRLFEIPAASSIYAVAADTELAWAELTTDVMIGVKDQYGNALGPTETWYFEVSFDLGNGNFGGTAYPGTYSIATAADHFHATYTRDQLETDISPLLGIKLLGLNIDIETVCFITLLDAAGAIM